MNFTQNVKAVVLDLDGTLLNSQKEVSERNERAILDAYKKGISIIFATARAPRSVRVFLSQELRNIASTIYYNGALVIDSVTGYRKHYPIESAVTEEIIEFVVNQDDDACLSIESEDIWYSNKALDYSKAMNAVVNPIIVSLTELKTIRASKILISQYAYYESLQEIFKEKTNVICTDNGTLVQIMAKHVSKQQAVLNLCREHHISMDEVMAFGDDWNDIELLTACRFPIAMGNAIQELKEIAYYTTKDNDEDGVAHVLEQLGYTVNNK